MRSVTLTGRTCALAVLLTLTGGAPAAAQVVVEHTFDVPAGGEAVATIAAGCTRCDWAARGREAAALKLSVDGGYSQHVLLTRGERPVEYVVMLGAIAAGTHRLTVERDNGRSARDAGPVVAGPVSVRIHPPDSPDYKRLS